MRPGEWNADDSKGKPDGRDDVSERQPPAREQKPDEVADGTQRPSTEVLVSPNFLARQRDAPERQECVVSDIECRTGPGDADYCNRHDHGRDQPSERHPGASRENPKDI